MRTPEEKSLRRRLVAYAVVVLVVLLLFLARLVWLQLVHGNAYYAQATAPPSSSAAGAHGSQPGGMFGESRQKTVV